MAEIEGMKDLKLRVRTLRKFPQASLKRAVRAAGRVVRDEARRRAPRLTGFSRTKIVTRDRRGQSREEAIVQVGFRRVAFYLRFAETGAKAHRITAGSTRRVIDPKTRAIISKQTRTQRARLVIRTGGLRVFRWAVAHPGVRARPFLGPALESTRAAAQHAMEQVFREQLEKAV
ncbi:MAG: hypothetical protein EWM72_02778 [Nitrospira sp.]|nr:MAG: hypothetical protein EWM72_02778 [Nitrospira sp.]